MIFAIHVIRTLRTVINTTLPIQVTYVGDDKLPTEKHQEMRALDPNVELINVRDYHAEAIAGLGFGGWAIIPFAALASSFAALLSLQTPNMDESLESFPGGRRPPNNDGDTNSAYAPLDIFVLSSFI